MPPPSTTTPSPAVCSPSTEKGTAITAVSHRHHAAPALPPSLPRSKGRRCSAVQVRWSAEGGNRGSSLLLMTAITNTTPPLASLSLFLYISLGSTREDGDEEG
nr:hypothetical protein Iba_scaffold47944CG0010 [Ipomoea batatas]GMD74829.1 hypothetical protein Iba_chr13aCG9050 [Ipomoea batatas]